MYRGRTICRVFLLASTSHELSTKKCAHFTIPVHGIYELLGLPFSPYFNVVAIFLASLLSINLFLLRLILFFSIFILTIFFLVLCIDYRSRHAIVY